MSPDAYCKRLTSLNLTQEQAGELFGASARNGQQWAAEGPPLPVAIVLLLVGNDRAKLDRVADKLAIKWRARSLPMAFLAARCHREDFGTILVAALSAVVDYA